MNRISLNRISTSILLGCLILAGHARAAPSRPNIILFLVDDYDKPETSVYGGKVLTPSLDRMAREGMTLHNAHVTSTVCTPSRYTFLTGRYAGSSYAKTYRDLFPEGRQGLPAFNVGLESDNMNVGRVLADAGYATGYVGKYHVHDGEDEEATFGALAVPKREPYSEALNKRLYQLEKRQRALIEARGFTWAKNIYWNNMKASFKGHNPEWTIQAALEFVEQHKQQPFYLHYCTTLLHGPNGEWHKSLTEKPLVTGEGIIKKPIGIMDRGSVMERIRAAGLTENEAGYLWMDDSLGLLLDQLDRLGLAENTIVVFASDHGSNKKGSLFKTRGTEIPCLIRWPRVIQASSQSQQLIQNTDFVPTWFAVSGAKVPATYHMDGLNLLPLFKDPDQVVREYVYGEQGPARSIKTREWSYTSLRYTDEQIEALKGSRGERFAKSLLGLSGGISRSAAVHPGAFDADQLYHLSRDPEEQLNLAGNPEQAKQLIRMQAFLTKTLRTFPHRPYGEFVAGPGTNPAQASEKVLQTLRKHYASESKKPRKKKSPKP